MQCAPARPVPPGAALSAWLWLSLASLFTACLGVAGDWSVTNGSLAGAMIALTFSYVSAVISIFGAEFNAVRQGKGDVTARTRPPTSRLERLRAASHDAGGNGSFIAPCENRG